LVVASIALAAAVFLFILPTRTYLAQRRSLSAAETRLQVFHDQNTKLAASVTRLQTDAEIEHLARERYGLVKPGEKAYLMVPPPTAAAPAKASIQKHAHTGLVPRLWHDVQFWH
jgi:cell division protein FtsB